MRIILLILISWTLRGQVEISRYNQVEHWNGAAYTQVKLPNPSSHVVVELMYSVIRLQDTANDLDQTFTIRKYINVDSGSIASCIDLAGRNCVVCITENNDYFSFTIVYQDGANYRFRRPKFYQVIRS